MSVAVGIPLIVVGLSALAASITDIRYFKVHNRLTFPLLVSGIVFHAVLGGWGGFQASLAGTLIGLGILLPAYLMGALGAGDVKFVAAIGAWLGTGPILFALAIGCMATGVYSVVLLAKHGRLREMGLHLRLAGKRLISAGRYLLADDRIEPVQTTVQRDDRRERLIPFSAMVSIGVFVLLLIALNVFDPTLWGM